MLGMEEDKGKKQTTLHIPGCKYGGPTVVYHFIEWT